MAEITAALVKDLREKTGAGMMDCKTALAQTQGDVEAAIDWLRKKGLAKAAKKSGRTTAEGLVGVAVDGPLGVIVEVNSETDFVGRNEDFQTLVRGILAVALSQAPQVRTDNVLEAPYPGASHSVAEAVAHAVATIGENISLRRAEALQVKEGVVASYIHSAISDGLGRIGVIVALESQGDATKLAALGRQIAMHIAAANPLALEASGLDAALVDRERAILVEKNAGKPEAVLAKIVESGLKTFYKEVCLVDQSFVIDATKTVSQILTEAGGVLKGFVRFQLGDGIEKTETEE